jgi:hypothetical protein
MAALPSGSINARPMHRTNPFIRSVGGGEKRWRDGDVGVQGRDDAQISVWVIHDLRRATFVRRPTRPRMSKSPHTPMTGSCSTVAQVIQSGDPVGLHADHGGPNTVEQNSGLSRDLLSRTVRLLSCCRCGPHRRFTNYSLWTQLSLMNCEAKEPIAKLPGLQRHT